MAVVVSFRASDDLLRHFDALVVNCKTTRAAMLRRLMAKAAQRPLLASISSTEPRLSTMIKLRISTLETKSLHREAASTGLSRSAWVSALVRRRLSNKPTLSRPDLLALGALQSDLRRIAANLNQIARSVDLACSRGDTPRIDAQYLEGMRIEVRGHLTVLRKALEGNLAYWAVEP